MQNGKSPGADGLTTNFYKYFWPNIKNIVFDSIQHGLKEKKLSIEQRRGVLSIITKKDKDIRKLENWRPLTLLNTDYKILAKALANRLQNVLDKLISYDQCGGLKGRSTFSNIRSTLDIINYTNSNQKPGYAIFLDYHKAFDSINWNFIYNILKNMNFGETYISYIKTLYQDIQTAIINNGNLSEFFSPTRGIRQGCPMSGNLFVLVVEILACAIRDNPKIRGIKIGTTEFKISQYADDTCIFVEDQNSFQNTFTIVEMFSKCSGLRINRNKSEALRIGSTAKHKHQFLGIRWPERYTKYLGVYISNDRQETIELNFKERIEKVETILQTWSLRHLSIKGKITVINTIAIPNMIYLSTVLHTPTWVIQKFQELVTKFIWNNKPSKIKYSNLIMTTENGGLKLQDYQSKIDSLIIRWIRELGKDYIVPWKAYVSETFGMQSNEIPYLNLEKADTSKFNEEFYNDVFEKWANLHHEKPTTPQEIGSQIIWGNSHIKVGEKTIKYNKQYNPGIKHIKDLLDENNQIGSKQFLENKFNTRFKGLEYESLISAIPKQWKKDIKSIPKDDIIISPYVAIKTENKIAKLCETKTNEIYWIHINKKGERATSENTWLEKSELNVSEEEWQTVYTGPYKIPTDAKTISFHHKITHRIIACGYNLKKWNIKEHDRCPKCNKTDTIEHYFVECQETKIFWTQIYNWWGSITQTRIPIATYEILFLYPNENDDLMTTHFNFILSQGLHYVYRNKKMDKQLDPYELKVKVKQRLILENEMSIKQNKEESFDKKWGTLIETL
jgi:hypothetical protein